MYTIINKYIFIYLFIFFPFFYFNLLGDEILASSSFSKSSKSNLKKLCMYIQLFQITLSDQSIMLSKTRPRGYVGFFYE